MKGSADLIPLDWYAHPPIDFEHKQYILFAYLKTVDNSFYDRIFSPFLLHTEKLVSEMRWIALHTQEFERSMERRRIITDGSTFSIITEKQQRPEDLETIIDIVDFSIPFLQRSVDLGKKLMGKGPTLLY